METLQVIQGPHGWALRFGAEVIATFRSRLDAIDQANWLCRKLRDAGAETRVLLEAQA